jgi:hypothetical protein
MAIMCSPPHHCVILEDSMESSRKAGLVTLIYNAEDVCSLQSLLDYLSHVQPPTAIQTDCE